MIIDTSVWGWPQWIVIVLFTLALATHALNHGKERPPYNAPTGFIAVAFWLFLLSAGGFFS